MSATAERQRILVVDDEPNITDLLSAALRYEGFSVDVAATGSQALASAKSGEPDLILLDVMLPDLDGLRVCERLRSDGNRVPVLFLTARDGTDDKVAGLKMGDDYVTKPFSVQELVARVEALLRRTRQSATEATHRLTLSDLVMDIDAHEVWRADQPLILTATEFKLLQYLLINAKRVVSKGEILDNVWDYDFEGDPNIVETYISYLRKKIDEFDPPLIQTVRGVGYCMRLPRT